MIATWNGRFRCVTTSLLGYGGTVERRTAGDPDISHEAEIPESVWSAIPLAAWWRWPWDFAAEYLWKAS
jgi:hypothetical protein